MDLSSSVLRLCVVVSIAAMAVIVGLMQVNTANKSKCSYDAIFSFGDSNSDTGGYLSLFPPLQSPPYGMTFFNKPAGRYSDGRLIIDFLAAGLGLPFLSPYIRSFGSDYRHGVNFASSAATTLNPKSFTFGNVENMLSPFFLQIQLNQMKLFKQNVEQSKGENNMPKADVFGKSLYTLYTGQNDFIVAFVTAGIDRARKIIPQMTTQITSFVEELYGLGGRAFMVFNAAPYGCFPAYLVSLPHEDSDIDEFGCMKSYNDVLEEYNNMLKQSLDQTRQQFADAQVIYVDIYALSLQLIRHPTSHGLKYGTKACCGFGGGKYNVDYRVFCGSNNVLINGENVTAEACNDVYNYVSWDGMHFTDTANKLITSAVLNGSYVAPHFPLRNLCDQSF